jgi:two-component system NarL family response regulator
VNGDDPIRVLIVDDHALFRRGLQLVLADEPDIEVVGEAADGDEAVERAAELLPTVVLMDVRMRNLGGIEATRRIRNAQPTTKVVMLTVSEDEEDLFASLRAGATGYLLKELSIEEVAGTVRAVAQGQAVVSPSMAAKLVNEFNLLSRRVAEQHGDAPRLTDRELEVLRLVAKGMSNKEIAGELVIAENTVKNHVRNILEKLELRTRMEAAMYAVREKLIDTP